MSKILNLNIPHLKQSLTNSSSDIVSSATLTSLLKINSSIVVASSYASDDVKKIANFVCTGTNDDIVINSAIQSLPLKVGGKLFFVGGLFNITNSIVIDRRISIQGEGSGLRHITDPSTTEGATTFRALANIDIITIDCNASVASQTEGITIRDVYFQGYDRNTVGNSAIKFVSRTDVCTIDNINIMDCYIGIIMLNCDATNICNSSIQWCALSIYMDKTSTPSNVGTVATVIKSCTFADNVGIDTYNGIQIKCGGIAIAEGYYVIISSCRFARCDGNGVALNAISLLKTSYIMITDNQFWGMKGNCIALLGFFSGETLIALSAFSKISGNQFIDYGDKLNANNLKNAIYIKGGNMTFIQDNFFLNTSGYNSDPAKQPYCAVYEEDNMNSWYGYTKVINNMISNHYAETSDKMRLLNAGSVSTGNIVTQL